MTPKCKICVDLVRLHEGGLSTNPADPGNWTGGKVGAGVLIGTNMGIAAPTLCAYLGREATAEEMRDLPPGVADAIYEQRYWPRMHGEDLPLPLAMVTLDAEVMSGLGGIDHLTHANHERAAGWLQEAVGVAPDGVIGPATIAAAAACDLRVAVVKACDLRLAFLKALPTWATFGGGWGSRVDDTRGKALALIHDEAES